MMCDWLCGGEIVCVLLVVVGGTGRRGSQEADRCCARLSRRRRCGWVWQEEMQQAVAPVGGVVTLGTCLVMSGSFPAPGTDFDDLRLHAPDHRDRGVKTPVFRAAEDVKG